MVRVSDLCMTNVGNSEIEQPFEQESGYVRTLRFIYEI